MTSFRPPTSRTQRAAAGEAGLARCESVHPLPNQTRRRPRRNPRKPGSPQKPKLSEGVYPAPKARYRKIMSFQFVVQRDLDGTWSVRERPTNVPALFAVEPCRV